MDIKNPNKPEISYGNNDRGPLEGLISIIDNLNSITKNIPKEFLDMRPDLKTKLQNSITSLCSAYMIQPIPSPPPPPLPKKAPTIQTKKTFTPNKNRLATDNIKTPYGTVLNELKGKLENMNKNISKTINNPANSISRERPAKRTDIPMKPALPPKPIDMKTKMPIKTIDKPKIPPKPGNIRPREHTKMSPVTNKQIDSTRNNRNH